MSAYYQMNENLSLAQKFRQAYRQFRDGKHGLEDALATMTQMTDTQRTTAYGFLSNQLAADALAEANSDIGGQLKDNAALAQFLAQFDG
jgi:hypothetical protein